MLLKVSAWYGQSVFSPNPQFTHTAHVLQNSQQKDHKQPLVASARDRLWQCIADVPRHPRSMYELEVSVCSAADTRKYPQLNRQISAVLSLMLIWFLSGITDFEVKSNFSSSSCYSWCTEWGVDHGLISCSHWSDEFLALWTFFSSASTSSHSESRASSWFFNLGAVFPTVQNITEYLTAPWHHTPWALRPSNKVISHNIMTTCGIGCNALQQLLHESYFYEAFTVSASVLVSEKWWLYFLIFIKVLSSD